MTEEYKNKIENQNLKIWKCICCQATLGFVEKKEVVRIKRQDVYIQISGGNISMNCYRCGKINYLTEDKPPETVDLKEIKS